MTTRPAWEDLPDNVINVVEARVGRVLKAENATDGIMPGLAARLDLQDGGHVFVKAIDRSHEAVGLHLREQWVGRNLPTDVPAPRMLWCGAVGHWHLMLFEYVNDNARPADLSPGSPDLAPVLEAMAVLGTALIPCPCPQGAIPVSSNVKALLAKSALMLASGRELDDRDMFAAAIEGLDLAQLRGNTLLHYDLSASNMLVNDQGVWVVDWSFAVRGAAWIDAALFAPRLVQAGHSPRQAEVLLSTLSWWKRAPAPTVAGLAAAWTLFRLYKAQHGPEEVREARARAAEAGRLWLSYQLARG
jgi:hypothetical protein